jgi:hypothetical protein
MESQLTAAAVPADMLTSLADEGPQRSNRGLLWFAYVGAIVIPIIGAIAAIYVGVSQRGATIRRHAFGIAAAAILSGVVWAVAISTFNSNHADTRVANDLKALLDQNGISYTDATCSHASGNQYSCIVDTISGSTPVQVTDDGHTIYEQGISAQ